MSIDDILFHSGEHRAEYFNAINPPIIQSSNFAFDSIADFKAKVAQEHRNYVYTRGINPTCGIAAQKIAALEHCEAGLLVGSGMAAISIAVLSQLEVGDHVLCVSKPYSWTYKLLTNLLPKYGMSASFFDNNDQYELASVIQDNTKVIYLESPNSWTYDIQDLTFIADVAKKRGIKTIIDNTHCSPIFQNPKVHGIDIVVHSVTKYLAGHSDVMAGVICSDDSIIKQIFDCEYMILGAVTSPHDASLIIRGLRTLPIRMQRSEESCNTVLDYLQTVPHISKIYHPYLGNHKEVVHKQMTGSGGLVTIVLDTEDKAIVEAFFDRLDKFTFAVSWGGYESLKVPILAFFDNPGKTNPPLPYQMIRLYIGLENPSYLIASLQRAFEVFE